MRLTIYFLFTCLMAACTTKPIPVTIPQQEAKTVVFSQVIPNRIMIIALTKSFGALSFNEENGDSLSEDALNQLLEDSAVVTITYDGNSDTLFQIEKGLYASITTPQLSNITYTLRIINDQGEVVTAESKMLEKVDFTSLVPSVDRAGDSTTRMALSFDDLPGKNWYMINYYKKVNDANSGGGIDIDNIFANGENNLIRTDVISDETFDGTYIDTVSFGKFTMSPSDTIAVTLSNINEDYFKFLDLRKRGGNLFSEVTREPISYPSNVDNGYGFFNTHYPDIKIFDLNEY